MVICSTFKTKANTFQHDNSTYNALVKLGNIIGQLVNFHAAGLSMLSIEVAKLGNIVG